MSGGREAKPAPKLDFGGLGLPPAPAAAQPEPEPVPEPAGTGSPAVSAVPRRAQEPRAAAPVAARKKRRRARAVADGGTGVYLPVALVVRLRRYAHDHPGRTYTDIALDAVEAGHGRLAELLAPVGGPRRAGPLFAGRASRRLVHDEPHQQVNLRFGDDDLTLLDRLVGGLAPNRSALLAAALDAYLPAAEVEREQ